MIITRVPQVMHRPKLRMLLLIRSPVFRQFDDVLFSPCRVLNEIRADDIECVVCRVSVFWYWVREVCRKVGRERVYRQTQTHAFGDIGGGEAQPEAEIKFGRFGVKVNRV